MRCCQWAKPTCFGGLWCSLSTNYRKRGPILREPTKLGELGYGGLDKQLSAVVEIFCKGKHRVDEWEVIKTMEARRHFFQEKELCFNCGRTGPWRKFCRSRGFSNCKSKHHTGLCNGARGNETETPLSSNAVLNGYTPSFEEKSLPANSPIETQRDHILGVSRHRIGEELNLKAINRLGLKPPRHESRQIVTVNGTKKQSLPVFSEKIKWVRK